MLSNIHLSIPYNRLDILEHWLSFIKKASQSIPMHMVLWDIIYPCQTNGMLIRSHNLIAYRFYGCEIDDGLNVNINYEPLGIKGINWLTILGPAFIEQMGGVDKLSQEAMALDLGVERAGENLIIQAGPYPDICDKQILPMNPYYVAVNHLLKPIRKTTIGSLHMDSMTGARIGYCRIG